jgi:hypothetical protein
VNRLGRLGVLTPDVRKIRHRAVFIAIGLLGIGGCQGVVVSDLGPGEAPTSSALPAQPGTNLPGSTFSPLTPCDPVLPRRVSRLSDQHLSHAIADLLAVEPPAIETGSLGQNAFLPGKAAAVNASVAVKLREVAEQAAQGLRCTADSCGDTFLDRFAARAFRRKLTAEERADLLAVYDAGVDIEGNAQGGAGLVVEAVLQSPSFVYLAELGTRSKDGLYRLNGYELASKLALFLTDSLPDDALWAAAESGKLDTDAGLSAELERLLALPDVRSNLSRAFDRFFDLESVPAVQKDSSLAGYSAALMPALYDEATWFVDDVLWKKSGTLGELLTSRHAKLDATSAKLYGVNPGEAMLPADERAGILTRAGLMAVKSHDDDTSIVHRGLTVARGLLCANPPPPDPAAVALDEELRKTLFTERGRAEARMEMACKGCHRVFDPLGITFEMYGPLGELRSTIPTKMGAVPVDSSYDLNVADLHGHVAGAVELSEMLAESRAARECMVQQVAAYAYGERLPDACTVGELAARFEESQGDLRALLKDVATWPALRMRREGTP